MKSMATLQHWPVVLVELDDAYTDEDLRGVIQTFEAAFRRRERYVNIVHPKGISSIPNAAQRAILTDWANREAVKEQQARWNIGTAVVIESPIIRGAITALMWAWSSPTAIQLVKTRAEACTWCAAQLDACGVPTTDGARHFLSPE